MGIAMPQMNLLVRLLLVCMLLGKSFSFFLPSTTKVISTKAIEVGTGVGKLHGRRRSIFGVNNRKSSTYTSTSINQSRPSAADNQYQALKRRSVTLPLIDLSSPTNKFTKVNGDSDGADKASADTIITPLPASHLPNELSTLHIYGMQLKAAIHKMMIDDTLAKAPIISPNSGSIALQEDIFNNAGNEPLYGHLISKESEDSLIGAIGCAAEIIMSVPSESAQIETISTDIQMPMSEEEYSDFDDPLNDGNTEDSINTVLTKGSFRFVVKEIKQTFPYPIVVVDELLDDLIQKRSDDESEKNDASVVNSDDEDDDDDDDYDMYADLDPSELMKRTLSAMKAIVDQKLDTKPKRMSPLEVSILEQSGMSGANANMKNEVQRNQAEEMGAIYDIFSSSLIDIAPSRTEMFYVVGMIAAEFGGLDNELRKRVLVCVDGVERLRIVVEALEKKISLVQAKKLTEDIVEKSDDSSKDLQVGKPTIPGWAKNLSKGTEIEYYWSEQDGWLAGTVVESAMVFDELIITVLFDDGETVRLPFDPDEKVRWKPAGM